MCGINGIIHFDLSKPVSSHVLRTMTDALHHRGPDDEGYHLDGNFGFGMRRLSIIDVAGGHQPISNEDRSLWVICNGEIYNYKHLRSQLEKRGHRFSTNSDTEVIVHQYEEDGEEFVSKLNGMFGLALWDSRQRKLIVARDRIGIKPLYYYLDSEKFVFSSEPKSILRHPSIVTEIDFQALWDFLTFRYVPAPRSMFRGIIKMYPGHYGILQDNEIKLRKYWDIPTKSLGNGTSQESHSRRDYLRLFEDQFISSVESHLMSDVPLGVLLSGGIDSSAVVYAMRKLGVNKVETFSVGFDAGPKFNELAYARKVADYFQTNHHEIVVSVKDFIYGLEKYIYYADEPLADLSCIPLWYVSKLASGRVKVVLSGEGSDELLAGYPGMEDTALKSRIISVYQNMPLTLKNSITQLASSSVVPDKLSAKLIKLSIPLKDFGSHYPVSMTNYFSEEEKEELLGLSAKDFSESFSIVTDLYRKQSGKSPLAQLLYTYSKYWLPDNLLTKADRMTMANSLELRVPFLDHEMIELAFRLPDSMKVDFSLGIFAPKRKAALRRIMKNCLPKEIITRKKYGFPTPENRWLETELNGFVKDILYSRGSFARCNYDISTLDKLFERSDSKDHNAQSKIWLLCTFEIWNKIFMQNKTHLS